MVLRALRFLHVAPRGLGPDVEAHPAVGDLAHDARRRSGLEALGDDVVGREQQATAVVAGRGGDATGVLDAIRLVAGVADRLAAGGHERVRHGAADREHVGVRRQGVEHGDLVGHLGAAQQDQQRAGRFADDLQVAELGDHEVTGRPPRQPLGDAHGGRVRPVGGAEGVVHVDVREVREGLGEVRVVPLLAGVEAEVLEQQDLAVRELAHGVRGPLADAFFAEGDAAAEELGEARRHRAQGHLRHALPLGSAQMRRRDHPGSALDQAAQRRNRARECGCRRGCGRARAAR